MKFRGILILLLLIHKLPAIGQVTIVSTDMPVANVHYLSRSASLPVDPQMDKHGPNQVWDFSGLQPTGSIQTDSFLNMNQIPIAYRAYFGIQKPNLVHPMGGFGGLDSLPLPLPLPKNMVGIYKLSTSAYTLIGVGAEMGGFPVPIAYKKPDVIMTFPMTAGKQDSSFSEVEFTMPGMFFYNQKQFRKNIADGWGKVITPYGKFDALRVITIIQQDDSIFIDTFKIGQRIQPPPTITFNWYTKSKGQPVLTISGSPGPTPGTVTPTSVSYMDTFNTAASIEQPDGNDLKLSIYPNPAKNRLTIENPYSENLRFEMMDMMGRVVKNGLLIPGRNDVELSGVKGGIYLVKVVGREGKSKIEKLILCR